MSSSDDIRPFTIHVPDDKLDQLRARVDITRLPDELDIPTEQQWDWGIPLSVLKPVVEYWKTQYDWRVVERKINETLPQFITHVDSLDHGVQEVHFVHKRSSRQDATPLIFVHGWPGNFLEASRPDITGIPNVRDLIVVIGLSYDRRSGRTERSRCSRVPCRCAIVRIFYSYMFKQQPSTHM